MDKSVKAIILAAGEGTRLKKYTKNLPKGMLDFAGKTLIESQIGLYRSEGIEEIIIVKGFAHEKINFECVKYYINHDFDSTNMLVSLFCAEEELSGSIIVSYSDILFEDALLRRIIRSDKDITVSVDMNWEKYWLLRYGSTEHDTESLKLSGDRIISLGRECPPAGDIDGRYIGLLKFSDAGTESLKKVWHKYRDEFWDRPWQVSGKPLRNAFMTDMIQAMIEEECEVHALKTENGWLEFDTNEDYEKAVQWQRDGTLDSIIRIH